MNHLSTAELIQRAREYVRGRGTWKEVHPLVQALADRLEKAEKSNETLKEHAEFGMQCYQDRCEGAYVHASVLAKVEARLKEAEAVVEIVFTKAQLRAHLDAEHLEACRYRAKYLKREGE